ncbi:MAG TPA: septum formation initiator family protein [Chthonomonadaceae bacterium]|nr:septum formation initiator family protein [Chthonomonadaceae bacterium]
MIIKPISPKTGPRRRAGWRGRAALIACGILVCLVFGWQGVQAAHPFLLAARLRSENDRIEREIHRYRLENQRAIKEIKEMETPEGIERAGREMGLVQPGEQRLRIPEK